MSFDWNDLRFFLAVAREGSTVAAGRALGVNQSTVQRRLGELERQIGRQLVQRLPSGYRLTEFGEAMRAHAEGVGASVASLEIYLAQTDRDAQGTIRVTCPEPVVYRISQTSLLDRFHARYPRIRVEFVVSDQYLDLMKGDADVALRSGDTEDNELVGRKIGDSIWAVYASKSYVERHGMPENIASLGQHALVGFEAAMSGHRVSKWLQSVAPNADYAARNNNVLGLLYSIKASMGVGPLPIVLGDTDSELVRVLGPIPELARIWRLLTRSDLRHTPRISAFFDFIVEEIDTLRPILSG